MNILVIYDSKYGHTEQIARAVAEAAGAELLHISDAQLDSLQEYDLVVVGSPTHGGWPTEAVKDLLTSPGFKIPGLAVFDTRTRRSLFGFAALRMQRMAEKNGSSLKAPPEGFAVKGIKGPLLEGELERASEWGAQLAG